MITREQAIQKLCSVDTGLTRKQIAEGLGLKKHPDLNRLIEKLASDGILEKREGEAPRNRAPMFWYRTIPQSSKMVEF